ncbi:hypothetical protein ABT352_01720 [Streptosporangium sp. NPDC000563]|uniref:hypothetical protein n=1 Tax=Streptosporangium sp. NPDC000563 TaxID=3154366 RepID=UPI0033330891
MWEYQLKVVPAKIRYRCLRDPDEDVIEPMRRPYRSQNARADRQSRSTRAGSPAPARIRADAVDCRGHAPIRSSSTEMRNIMRHVATPRRG